VEDDLAVLAGLRARIPLADVAPDHVVLSRPRVDAPEVIGLDPIILDNVVHISVAEIADAGTEISEEHVIRNQRFLDIKTEEEAVAGIVAARVLNHRDVADAGSRMKAVPHAALDKAVFHPHAASPLNADTVAGPAANRHAAHEQVDRIVEVNPCGCEVRPRAGVLAVRCCWCCCRCTCS